VALQRPSARKFARMRDLRVLGMHRLLDRSLEDAHRLRIRRLLLLRPGTTVGQAAARDKGRSISSAALAHVDSVSLVYCSPFLFAFPRVLSPFPT